MMQRFLVSFVVVVLLSGCASTAERLSRVGQPPEMTKIVNPTAQPDYQPVSLPMPEQRQEMRNANSLWAAGNRSFFKDLRASEVGDVLTVLIEIRDTAELTNTTERTRTGGETGGFSSLFGLENQVGRVLSGDPDPANLVGFDTQSNSRGDGAIDREEKIDLKVASMVVQKLPNNNLVIHGRQEVRVNSEVRELHITGIVRPQDITVSNTISHDQIAEARISYGGRGTISDVQRPRYGQEVLDIILPF